MAKTSSTVKPAAASAKAEEAKKTTVKAEVKADAPKAAEKKAATTTKAAESAAKASTQAPKKAEKATATTKAATKTTEKKTAEKKAATTTTKAASIKSSMVLQVLGKEISEKDLVAQIKKVWTSQFKGKLKDIKTIDIYVKPEDGKAYFVINGKTDPTYFVEL